jgi:chromate transport protein ChrA
MEQLAVNMYDYLIVSGLYSLIISIISIIFTVFFIDKMKNTKTTTLNYSFFMLFLYITGLFNIIWNIIGSIIFWKYMDNNQCSNEVSNYLFTSLIIKLIFSSTILLNNNNKSK